MIEVGAINVGVIAKVGGFGDGGSLSTRAIEWTVKRPINPPK
jgi:hypothetical protein